MARRRLVHLTATPPDELAVRLALEQIGADHAGLQHLPAQWCRGVEVGPVGAELAVLLSHLQVEQDMKARNAFAKGGGGGRRGSWREGRRRDRHGNLQEDDALAREAAEQVLVVRPEGEERYRGLVRLASGQQLGGRGEAPGNFERKRQFVSVGHSVSYA